MAEQSKIEWTDATWNPITGCTLVSEGCRHCYAAKLAATRMKNHPSRKGLARMNAAGEAKFTGEVRFNEQWLDQPLRWKRPRKIFVCAHGDLFHEAMPDEWIDRVYAVMALASHHTFQVVTKRPERAREYLAADRRREINLEIYEKPKVLRRDITDAYWPLPNVWLGTSVEDQATADARIPHLLATPAAIRFVSAEPLLGPLRLDDLIVADGRPGEWHVNALDAEGGDPADDPDFGCNTLDWIIVGGESGPKARPMHPDWALSLRDQCQAAGVAFFFKQWGEYAPAERLLPSEPNDVTYWPDGTIGNGNCNHNGGIGWSLRRVGKARAGRLLDGREWSEVPV